MKTIDEIKTIANLKDRRTVYYRIRISGIEDKQDYKAQYTNINGRPERCFSEEEAELLIDIKRLKEITKNKERVS